MDKKKNKFNLGAFDTIAKVNEAIEQEEKQAVTKNLVKNAVNDINKSDTQEIDLSGLNLNIKGKDLKVQKSLALKKSTIKRLDKLAKKFGTSISDIADKAIRTILHLEN